MEKKYIQLFSLISILLVISVNISALNYIVNFSGAGAATTVDSVIVQNLTQGTIVTVPTGNILVLSDQTNAVEQLTSNNETIRLYPIDLEGKYSLSFYSKNSGITHINAYSIEGRKMTGLTLNLQVGINSFQLLLPKGMYALQVSGNGYTYTSKMVNLTGSAGKTSLTYIGSDNSAVSAQQKSKKSFSTIQMDYTTGDRLLYKGFSRNFCTITTDIPVESKTINFDFVECKDAFGNYYSVVKIGGQIWMAENLKTTKYRNGDDITNFTNNTDWGMYSISSWCNYNNDATNSNNPGKLYNWYAVFDSRNITPVGWHIPSDSEWTMLTSFLGGENVSGGKLKETDLFHWGVPNTSATNEVGFTALPGGYRLTSGQYDNLGNNGYWWSLTENGINYAWYRYIYKGSASVVRDYYNKNAGFSIRCVKDADLPTLTTVIPSSITYTTAIGGGNITSNGGAPVTACGVCWSTTKNPTILDNKSIDTIGLNTFRSSITGLNINITYYIRAYATNISGTGYGEQVVFNSMPYDSIIVTDADGNLYHTITIGTQKWMVENLKTTKYRNGDLIGTTSYINMDLTNEISPKYQWAYNGLESNVPKYGRLYTWYAVADSRNIAPSGWHVASDNEWAVMQNYLITNGYNYDKTTTDNKISKSLCSTSLWITGTIIGSPSCDLTKNNASGFSMVPSGYRGFDGYFYLLESGADIWTSTEYSTSNSMLRFIGNNDLTLNNINSNKNYGLPVRCIKNSVPNISTNKPSLLTTTSLSIGGNITADGGETVIERGVCWGTKDSPDISGSKITIGSGTGSFAGSITGLVPNTTYFLRIYAINSIGTAYGEQISIKTLAFDPPTVTDVDGNLYHSVTIGSQTWMLENLKTTKYRNGDIIGTTSSLNMDLTYATSPEYQWAYNGLESNVPPYGRLYTWYAVTDSRYIAPVGWHVASDAEWSVLQNYLISNGYNYDKTTIDNKIGKSLCTISLWNNSYIIGTPGSDLTQNNSSGFSMVAGGYRGFDGYFYILGNGTDIWTSTESSTSLACVRGCGYADVNLGSNILNKNYGFSVRCIKNSLPIIFTNKPTSTLSTNIIINANITTDGGEAVTKYGVCWNTSESPTIADSYNSNGSVTGSFSDTINGLIPNTTYYLRAYAINSLGIVYGEQMAFKTLVFDPPTVTDVDGNLYHSIIIGSQTWMVENLKTTKYRNGDIIGTTNSLNTDLTYATTPEYQWAYNGMESNVPTYGRLYTWYVIADSRNIAPAGWHVASDAEWLVLQNYLIANGYNYDKTTIDNKIGKSLCTTSLWNNSYISGTPGNDLTQNNSSGFSMVAGGYRGFDGYFYILGNGTDIWTSTESSTLLANVRGCGYADVNLGSNIRSKNYGFSVRCLKD